MFVAVAGCACRSCASSDAGQAGMKAAQSSGRKAGYRVRTIKRIGHNLMGSSGHAVLVIGQRLDCLLKTDANARRPFLWISFDCFCDQTFQQNLQKHSSNLCKVARSPRQVRLRLPEPAKASCTELATSCLRFNMASSFCIAIPSFAEIQAQWKSEG